MHHGRPAKRRRLTPPINDDVPSETIKASDLFNRAADWDLEQAYEHRSRHKKSKEITRLPIKTAAGNLEQARVHDESDSEADSFLGSDSDKDQDNTDASPIHDSSEKPEIPLQEQVLSAKEEIARLASLLNEDPEEHAGAFKKLAHIAGPDAHPSIHKLMLAAQAAVYKDVIPGYRIRAYKEEDLGTKVSKDVRQTRQYEQALVMGYQAYVKRLASLVKAKNKASDQATLKTVALNCACKLLLSVPHFNFRTELLGILIHEMSSRDSTPDFVRAVETFEAFFQGDEDGAPSLEAVNMLSKMMKAKDYRVREEVLNTFLHLRLLSELSIKSSTARSDKNEDENPKLHGRKVKKEKWEHRSKKERKVARERKVIEKDMREASAAVDYEEREKMQSETLKMVFICYFRILKAKSPELMGAVLEGLAKYAHLINQDFFGDILEALKDIISQAESAINVSDNEVNGSEEDLHSVRNHTREALLSTQTAFTLLSSQEVSKSAASLHLDLATFTSHIYRTLYPLTLDADLELGPKSLHLLDPHQTRSSQIQMQGIKNKVNVSTPILLLTRVLTAILLTPSTPSAISPILIATFFKRLLTTTLQMPERSALSLLSLLSKIANKHGKKIEALWYSDERKGDGVYKGDAESIEGTGVWSMGTGVWEGELLRKHWAPSVRDCWKQVDVSIRDLGR